MRKNIVKRNIDMMKKVSKNIGEQKAITLIALIVTIVVLLILASVSIAMLTGENGIINKASTAKEKNNEAQEQENITLADYENKISKYVDGNRDTVTIPKEEYDMLKNTNSYSTTEQVVGTWIDGKPIYRKYLEPTSLKVDDNVDKIVDIKIYFYWNGEQEVANPCYSNNEYRAMGYYKENTKSIEIIKHDNAIVQYLFVEYTKTTD